MTTKARIGMLTLACLGFVLTFAVPLVGRTRVSDSTLALAALGGGLVLTSSMLLLERPDDGQLAAGNGSIPTRFRAGWLAFWLLMAPLLAMGSIAVYTGYSTPEWFLVLVGPGGIALKEGLFQVLHRRA